MRGGRGWTKPLAVYLSVALSSAVLGKLILHLLHRLMLYLLGQPNVGMRGGVNEPTLAHSHDVCLPAFVLNSAHGVARNYRTLLRGVEERTVEPPCVIE